ncbi:hypothetical protein GBF38_000938, partial [Nibea albiflora]
LASSVNILSDVFASVIMSIEAAEHGYIVHLPSSCSGTTLAHILLFFFQNVCGNSVVPEQELGDVTGLSSLFGHDDGGEATGEDDDRDHGGCRWVDEGFTAALRSLKGDPVQSFLTDSEVNCCCVEWVSCQNRSWKRLLTEEAKKKMTEQEDTAGCTLTGTRGGVVLEQELASGQPLWTYKRGPKIEVDVDLQH